MIKKFLLLFAFLLISQRVASQFQDSLLLEKVLPQLKLKKADINVLRPTLFTSGLS